MRTHYFEGRFPSPAALLPWWQCSLWIIFKCNYSLFSRFWWVQATFSFGTVPTKPCKALVRFLSRWETCVAKYMIRLFGNIFHDCRSCLDSDYLICNADPARAVLLLLSNECTRTIVWWFWPALLIFFSSGCQHCDWKRKCNFLTHQTDILSAVPLGVWFSFNLWHFVFAFLWFKWHRPIYCSLLSHKRAAQSRDGLTPHILLSALSAPLPLPATSPCPDPRLLT